MKNLNIRFLLILATVLSTQLSKAQNTELRGDLQGLPGKKVLISYLKNGVPGQDTVNVHDGKFTWKANLKEPQQIFLMFPRSYYAFFIQAGKARLTGLKDSVSTFKVSGSPIQAEAEQYEASTKEIAGQESKLYADYGKGTKAEEARLEEQLDELKKQKTTKADQYIAQHPKSFFSLYLVSNRASYGYDYADIKRVYDLLDPAAKAAEQGKKISERLAVLYKSRIGGQMMDFTQADTSGVPVKFSQFAGKYVLVDFWASWCGPCRAENPNVLLMFDTYKNKNFTVLGISLDEKSTNWKKAIKDDKMPWTQLSDLKGWKNEVSGYFGIQGIPSNLLIDPAGRILGKDLRGAMLAKKLKELLD